MRGMICEAVKIDFSQLWQSTELASGPAAANWGGILGYTYMSQIPQCPGCKMRGASQVLS